ncbi:type II toxin-antitoxin system VapC family toxin [Eggerthella sp. YY7918]|uniref:type II toxin-antitoxin system VapC family toxin n=1 Tax=Eggerthella sp. (strain YY7918) TaxID=502558 RepID=UPI000217105C|nr:type II toxin-antitoxin system VapC family toxin [Eggerthella sp. YY7918]BAK43851.1 hypothetical protein EGYY_06500 [Eggerthella sp. YY7918]
MIVLDANAAIAMMRKTEEGEALLALMLEGESVIAPTLLHFELANALAKYVRRGELSSDELPVALQTSVQFVDTFYPGKELTLEATSEAVRLNHPVYDLFYLVLARRTGSTLFTLNKRLQNLCLDNGVNCVFLDTEC